jgi:hypothetical protein
MQSIFRTTKIHKIFEVERNHRFLNNKNTKFLRLKETIGFLNHQIQEFEVKTCQTMSILRSQKKE